MAYGEPARTAPRRIRIRKLRVVGLVVALAVISSALGFEPLESSSSTALSRIDVLRGQHRALPIKSAGAPGEPAGLRSGLGGALGEAGGAVPDGATVFDDGIPGIANLDPALLGALRQAATDAAQDGTQLLVDSGWRSPAYQEQLLQQAVSKYGSREEAARWVATPKTSAHVSGEAVDLGPADAASWLSAHGAAYGLCQIYVNEPWHFELRQEAVAGACPAMYADPTQDPRMQP